MIATMLHVLALGFAHTAMWLEACSSAFRKRQTLAQEIELEREIGTNRYHDRGR